MKTFGGRPIEEAQKKIQESRKRWEDLKKNNPEEYKQKMKIVDRWQSQTDASTNSFEDQNV